MQQNKVFACLGPYKPLRVGLRRRGWVEKFYHVNLNFVGEGKQTPKPRSQTVPRIGPNQENEADYDEYGLEPLDEEYVVNPNNGECGKLKLKNSIVFSIGCCCEHRR